jgi:protein-S-isoprenylcysteine O-methyltransferase Ste14
MRFLYHRDPLFIACLVLYLANRFLLKPNFSWYFLHAYLNDLICIPFLVPLLVFLTRNIGLRSHDLYPELHEIVLPVVVWSLVFECILPEMDSYRGPTHSDLVDVLCYLSGALVASLFWSWYYPDNIPVEQQT